MGLNDLQLPASLVVSLYANHLNEGDHSMTPPPSALPEPSPISKSESSPVITIAENPVSKAPPPPQNLSTSWKFLGNNHQKILILVNYPSAPILPDEELAFLTRMLEACSLSLGDVAIVNTHHYASATPKDYLAQFDSKIVFLFGIDPLTYGLPVSFPAFQVQAVAKTKYLFTPALEARIEDPLFKSKLWVSLKRIFGI
jgi:hypothetical protein